MDRTQPQSSTACSPTTCISSRSVPTQRADNPDIRYTGVVHNGVDLDVYPLIEHKDDFLVYIGRANPDKGPTLAIEVARRAGLPLAMVVKKNEPFEHAYWDEIVAPLFTTRSRCTKRSPTSARSISSDTPRDGVPDPVARAVRPRDGGGDGVRHAGRRVPGRRGGGARRRGRDRIPPGVDRRSRAGGRRVGSCSPITCRQRVTENFSADDDGRSLRAHLRGSDLHVITAVTGATGHVGANLVRALLDDGRTVRAVNRQPGAALAGLDVEFVAADVGDPDGLQRAFEGVRRRVPPGRADLDRRRSRWSGANDERRRCAQRRDRRARGRRTPLRPCAAPSMRSTSNNPA